MHTKMLEYSKELNAFYNENKSLWQEDFDWRGFHWIDCNDNENSVISFIRYADDRRDFLIVVCNFTPEVRRNYRIGVPVKGIYREVFNSDAERFGGSNVLNEGPIKTEDIFWHNLNQSVKLSLPPLSTICLKLTAGPADSAASRLSTAKRVTAKAAAAALAHGQLKAYSRG